MGIGPRLSRSSHTSDLEIGTIPVTLPGAWRCRVSANTGWPDVRVVGGSLRLVGPVSQL